MRCPQCVRDCVASEVSIGVSSQTLLGGRGSYYDVDDKLHTHDPNVISTDMRCERGHSFVVNTRKPCPSCDYGHVDPIVKELAGSTGRGR